MKDIMIVDDSRVVRKLIVYILDYKNYCFLEAENGLEALEVLVSANVDLIITDLNMPKMSGLELVRAIRELETYNSIPILMLTFENNEEDKQKCLRAGVNTYLAKPLPAEELIEKIEQLLKTRQL